MNREVHYIFSIQTQDYLKSAWERGRLVYLMISPIAQCRADASGNFRKAVEREDRTAASCLSNLQNMNGLIKRRARNNNNYEPCLLLNFKLRGDTVDLVSYTTIHTSSIWWIEIYILYIFLFLSILIFVFVHTQVLHAKFSTSEIHKIKLQSIQYTVFYDYWHIRTVYWH